MKRDKLKLINTSLIIVLIGLMVCNAAVVNRESTNKTNIASTDGKFISDKIRTTTSTLIADSVVVGDATIERKSVPETAKPQEEVYGYIFIGDSRFVGMSSACNIESNENYFVVAEVGEGYDYLVNTALPKAEEIKSENTDVAHWKYIICLGVNDLYNIDNYIATYENLKTNVDLVLVSVSPIEYHKSITNESIVQFNSKIREISDIQYVDSYSVLMNNGFNTVDGIHFDYTTYETIYNTIINDISTVE